MIGSRSLAYKLREEYGHVGNQGVTLLVEKVSEERGSVNYEGPVICSCNEKKHAQQYSRIHRTQRKTRGCGMFPEGTCGGVGDSSG
jgi:hypothetical protein